MGLMVLLTADSLLCLFWEKGAWGGVITWGQTGTPQIGTLPLGLFPHRPSGPTLVLQFQKMSPLAWSSGQGHGQERARSSADQRLPLTGAAPTSMEMKWDPLLEKYWGPSLLTQWSQPQPSRAGLALGLRITGPGQPREQDRKAWFLRTCGGRGTAGGVTKADSHPLGGGARWPPAALGRTFWKRGRF